MDYYSIWDLFISIAILTAFASMPVFAAADALPSPHRPRLVTLDGLRGFLELAVLFHHGSIFHVIAATGSWGWPPSRFYILIGSVGVAMFFMITGFLFWGRLIDEHGRPRWLQLYIGRVFRVGPLFLVALLVTLILVFMSTGPHRRVEPLQLIVQIARWLSLGALYLPDINGYVGTNLLSAGVAWTLRFEWAFYALLPILAVATRWPRLHLPAALLGLALALSWLQWGHSIGLLQPTWWSFFLAGMVCASCVRCGVTVSVPDWATSGMVLALVAGAFTFDTVEQVGPVVLLGAAFFLISSGSSLFSLLTTRPARRLGEVSYGIYLLHGFVFTILFENEAARAFDRSSPLSHWLMVLVCAMLVIAIATVMHVVVERPGITLGKIVANRISRLGSRLSVERRSSAIGRSGKVSD